MKTVLDEIRHSGSGLFYIGGVVLALLAGFAVWASLSAAVPKVNVLVITRDLPPGTRVIPSDITMKSLPAVAVPKGALRSPNDVHDRRIRFGLTAGDVVRESHLVPHSMTIMAERLTQQGADYRAVSLPAELVPVADRLMPGDRLSIIAVLPVQGEKTQSSMAVSLGVVTVLEVNYREGQGARSTVVVALTTDQVSRLALASRSGSLTIAVLGDQDSPELTTMRMEDLAGAYQVR